MSSRPLALLAGLCALLPLAGCGGDAAVRAQHRVIGLKLDEYRITPQTVSAPAGSLRIIARNRGRLTHNVKVETIPSDPEAAPVILGGTDTLQPGGRDEKPIVLAPGRYRLACTIANHDVLGQFGTLIVK